jgi:peroxiredoxin
MHWIALGGRVLLSIVFITAAVGKFADQEGTRRALLGFGMPFRWTRPAAPLLPAAELAVGVALIFAASARAGAIGALVLLTGFVLGITRAMARGEAPDCHCFGQISSAPAGPRTLARNAVLFAPAIFVLAYGPGNTVAGSIQSASAAELIVGGAVALVVALSAFVAHLLIQNRSLGRELAKSQEALSAFPAGLPVGTSAPKFSLPAVDGRTVSFDEFAGRGKPMALVFVSPSCLPCRSMLPDLARWQKTLADRITIVPLSVGNLEDNRELAREYDLEDLLVQHDAEVFEMYRAAATPAIVIVSADGHIASQVRSSHTIVEAVVRRQLQRGPAELDVGPANGGTLQIAHWTSATGSG